MPQHKEVGVQTPAPVAPPATTPAGVMNRPTPEESNIFGKEAPPLGHEVAPVDSAIEEAKIAVASVVFFCVPLLVVTAQIVLTAFLEKQFPDLAKKAQWELNIVYWAALAVTVISGMSAVLIVARSFAHVFRLFIKSWRDFWKEL